MDHTEYANEAIRKIYILIDEIKKLEKEVN